MRPVPLLLILILGWVLPVSGAPQRRESGVESILRVDLVQWGAQRALAASLSPHGDEVHLGNRSTRLTFKLDSQRMIADGTEIRLAYPVIHSGNRALISQHDIDSTLMPLLSPPRRPATRPIRLVAVNAGHGGKDPGNTEGHRQEKQYTLMLAGEVRRALERAGLKVLMIRQGDTFVDLEERAALANRARADLYVSLHFNSVADAGSVNGVETYCLTPAGTSSTNDTGNHGGTWQKGNRCDRDNIVLARQIQRAVVNGTDLDDRGVRRAHFQELTLLEMPGVLVEGGYMTNPGDSRILYTPEGRTKLARAIVDGILAYKRLVERGGAE